MYHALIVDDELSGRQCIRTLLNKNFARQISRISEASDFKQAFAKITQDQPDVIFLDISLNGESAFDLLDQVKDIKAEIIFVSAYNEFAVRAFRYAAIDYLEKPVDEELFNFAVQKTISRLFEGNTVRQLNNIIKTILQPERKRLAVSSGNSILFIDLVDIIYCEADGNYTNIYVTRNDQKHCISRTLKSISESIGTEGFVRVHQSYLVNMDHVTRYQRGEGGTVYMRNGAEIPVSRANREIVINALINRVS